MVRIISTRGLGSDSMTDDLYGYAGCCQSKDHSDGGVEDGIELEQLLDNLKCKCKVYKGKGKNGSVVVNGADQDILENLQKGDQGSLYKGETLL